MPRGYDTNLVAQNASADEKHIGVLLGRVCISKGIPVQQVASDLGATRQAVYNWFRGTAEPNRAYTALIRKFLAAS